MKKSILQESRLQYKPQYPKILNEPLAINWEKGKQGHDLPAFPILDGMPELVAYEGMQQPAAPLRVGIVFSGGQAPGGHNVILGLFHALKKIHPDSELIGFIGGPSGILNNKTMLLSKELVEGYANQGGFDLIGSGRTKIETVDHFKKAAVACAENKLSGLVIAGGDDSNTNAAHLAEYFLSIGNDTKVIGIPKTIDGDIQNEFVEISFGFDTACKVYSEIIGNIAKDALSAKKYYFFIKLMGRRASHVAIECALTTHPNMTLVTEEISHEEKTLLQVVDDIANLVVTRANIQKHYGMILIPEGAIEVFSDVKKLILSLNRLLARGSDTFVKIESLTIEERVHFIEAHLEGESKLCFAALPLSIQEQLLHDRDPHGNVQVSKIDTEKLLIQLVDKKLRTLCDTGCYSGNFMAIAAFCGYEGRSALPSNFDANYCYALGSIAAALIFSKKTAYMATCQGLHKPPAEWQVKAAPLPSMMHYEERDGKEKLVMKKGLVELSEKPFQTFVSHRYQWMLEDSYVQPGPIQFFGPKEITDTCPKIIQLKGNV